MTKKLRPYQVEFIKNVLTAFTKNKRVIGTLPTSAGKTVIASSIVDLALKKNKTVFFICNREELVMQTFNEFSADSSLLKAGMENMFDPTKKVQIIMINTLYARLAKTELPQPDLIIIDEIHMFSENAKMTKSLYDKYPEARYLGLTATPIDSRGRPIKNFYIVDSLQTRDLQAMGYLVKDKWFIAEELDLTKVGIAQGDYKVGELSETINKTEIVENIVENYKKIAEGKKCMVFGVDIAHAESIAKAFQDNGYEVGIVHSQMENKQDRPKILKDFASGKLQVLVNVMALTTGYNEPTIECLILARPTKSLRLGIQMVGRGLRTIVNKNGDPDPSLKSECIILDCGNVVKNNGGILTKRRNFMEEEFEGEEKTYVSGRKCPNCKMFNEKGLTCENCGCLLNQKRCSGCGKLHPFGTAICDFCNAPLKVKAIEIDPINADLKEFKDVEDEMFESEPTQENLERLIIYCARKHCVWKNKPHYRKKAFSYLFEELEKNLETIPGDRIKRSLIALVSRGHSPYAIRHKIQDWVN